MQPFTKQQARRLREGDVVKVAPGWNRGVRMSEVIPSPTVLLRVLHDQHGAGTGIHVEVRNMGGRVVRMDAGLFGPNE